MSATLDPPDAGLLPLPEAAATADSLAGAEALPPPRTSPHWDWPFELPAQEAQQIIDVGLVLVLEQSEAAFHREFQRQALQRLVDFIERVSPLWRDWLGTSGPQGRAKVLEGLPILGRAEFRALVERLGPLPVPPSHGKVVPHSTSGSTGMPVKFFVSELALRMVRNHYMADHQRHGRDLLRRRAALGSRIDPHPGRPHVISAGDPWMGEGPLHVRRNIDYTMEEHAHWLRALAPVYLAVNPTVLSGVLEAFEAGVPPPAGMEQVMTYGATVEPELRRRTRVALGASIRDRYSCEEIGPIAFQCPFSDSDDPPYHVCVSNAIVEVVDDSGRPCAPGQVGRVLLTGLHHYASPVLRYDVGDVAALSPRCSCGAQVPVLTRLLGRKRGLIRTPSGQGRFVRMTASDWLSVAPVREHRLVQTDSHTVRVEVVASEPLTEEQRLAIVALLGARVSPEFTWDLQQVDAIDWPPAQKRQDVVCLV